MLDRLAVVRGETGALATAVGCRLMGRSMLRWDAEAGEAEAGEAEAGEAEAGEAKAGEARGPGEARGESEINDATEADVLFSGREKGPATVTTVSEAMSIAVASSSTP
jgi:hypothetical protein